MRHVILCPLIVALLFSWANGQTTRPALPASPGISATVLLSPAVNLAAQSWKAGTKYVLPAGTLPFAGSIYVPNDCEIVGAKNPNGSNATTIDYKPVHSYSTLFAISSKRVSIHNLNLRSNAAVLIAADGTDMTLANLSATGGQLWISRSANRLHVTGCTAGILPMYWAFFAPPAPGITASQNITIDHCSVGGSIGGHCIRAEPASHVLVEDCQLANPESIPRPAGYVHGECVKVGGGNDWTFRRVTFNGPLQIGANRQAVSGFTPIVDGIRFENCTDSSGYVILDPGVKNMVWIGCTVHCDGSGAVFGIRGNTDFPDRPIVTGHIDNSRFTYGDGRSGELFFGGWYGDKWVNHVKTSPGVSIGPGVTFNGKPVPQR